MEFFFCALRIRDLSAHANINGPSALSSLQPSIFVFPKLPSSHAPTLFDVLIAKHSMLFSLLERCTDVCKDSARRNDWRGNKAASLLAGILCHWFWL